MLIGFYNYTVILTYASLLISTAGIFLAATGDVKNAVIYLMLSGLCDMFDGKIASTMDRNEDEKKFGIQIDSLCDLVCFGVLPTIICYQMSLKDGFFILTAGLYILAGLIRLAYFNVMEGNRQESAPESAKVYQGLPITCVALILPIIYILAGNDNPFLYSISLLILAIAFVTPIKIKKPAMKGMMAMSALGLVEMAALLVGRI